MKGDYGTKFIVGRDYHLGDLLWLTAVIAEYRRQRSPSRIRLSLPDVAVSRILENNPLIDEIEYRGRYGFGSWIRRQTLRQESPGNVEVVCDLRVLPLGTSMVRDWRRRWPWLYYRDLWFQPRGQWLATYLGLGRMSSYMPILNLCESDFEAAQGVAEPFVVLAPHIGSYTLPISGRVWRKVKGWEDKSWTELARNLQTMGFAVVTLGAGNQTAIAGTRAMLGLPIRQAAGVIGQASGLISGESGLWFVAAALQVPFVIVPWWLPRAVDWPGAMGARACLIRRDEGSVDHVTAAFRELIGVPPPDIGPATD